MKCPKCGYTSFDYLDSCKKCHHALGEFKAKYGLRSLLFPNRPQQPAAPSAVLSTAAVAAAAPVAAAAESSDFGYDFLSDTPAPSKNAVAAAPANDSFDFDSDWTEAPSAPASSEAAGDGLDETEADPFDFMADTPEPAANLGVETDDLHLDLGELSAPLAAADEETDFDFNESWDEAAPDERPPVAAAVEEADFAFDASLDETVLAESPPVAASAEETVFGFDAGQDTTVLAEKAPVAAMGEETVFAFDASLDEISLDETPPFAATAPAEEPLPEFVAEPLAFGDEFDFTDDEQPDLTTTGVKHSAFDRKQGPKEGPSDPFDQRETAPVGPAPATAGSTEEGIADAGQLQVLPPSEPAEELEERFAPREIPFAAATSFATAPVDEPEDDEDSPFADEESLAEFDQEEVADDLLPRELRPAGVPFFRLGAGALDLLLLGLIYSLFLAAGKLVLFPADQAVGPLPPEALIDLAIPYFLILFALCFGYFTLFHFLSGQTPGKMVFRLKVESSTGQPIDFSQAFLRSVGGLISLLCAGIGFVFILRGPEHLGWNDRLAGTRVIETGPSLTTSV